MFGLIKKPEATLFKAVWSGDERKARETLAAGITLVNARVNAGIRRDHPELEEGATPLHLAARRGHTAIVEMLLSLRADPNAASISRATALHCAAIGGHADIAEMLLDRGVSVDAKDAEGYTPLLRAARAAHEDVVELLLARGASPTEKNNEGSTPLHEAALAGSRDVTKFLLGVGADVTARDDRGRTPVHRAILGSVSAPGTAGGHAHAATAEATAALLQMLLNQGADINALDKSGETAFDMLVYLGGRTVDPALVKFFAAHGGECVRYRARQPAATQVSPQAQAQNATLTQSMAHAIAAAAGGTPAPGAAPGAAPAGAQQPHATASWGSAPILFGDKPILIGRNPDCDVRYLSLTLSHRHARIEPRDGAYYISDAGSRNGVLIDNVKISGPHRLQPNELVTLGAYEFEFDGQQLIPTRGELPEADLLAEQRIVNARNAATNGTTVPPATPTGSAPATDRPRWT